MWEFDFVSGEATDVGLDAFTEWSESYFNEDTEIILFKYKTHSVENNEGYLYSLVIYGTYAENFTASLYSSFMDVYPSKQMSDTYKTNNLGSIMDLIEAIKESIENK